MNLVTAAKMLVLLEQSQHSGIEDHAYFIILHALKSELSKGNDPKVLQVAYQEYGRPTDAENQVWLSGNKVGAIKLYRERTGSGLYESKKALEAAEQDRSQEVLRAHEKVFGVTSCG